MDRTIYSSKIFCETLVENKYISPFGLDLFVKKMNEIIQHYFGMTKLVGTNKVFYIMLLVEFWQKNLEKRNRNGEAEAKDMTAYQFLLQEKYKKF